MKILINRFLSTGNETLGALYIKEGKDIYSNALR